MVYLIILVLVAGAGIGRLWWIQRKHETSLQTVDGFRSSLERLSEAPTTSGTHRPMSPPRPRASAMEDLDDPSLASYREPLDPERRAAAKRRLEARRRGLRSDLNSR